MMDDWGKLKQCVQYLPAGNVSLVFDPGRRTNHGCAHVGGSMMHPLLRVHPDMHSHTRARKGSVYSLSQPEAEAEHKELY